MQELWGADICCEAVFDRHDKGAAHKTAPGTLCTRPAQVTLL